MLATGPCHKHLELLLNIVASDKEATNVMQKGIPALLGSKHSKVARHLLGVGSGSTGAKLTLGAHALRGLQFD